MERVIIHDSKYEFEFGGCVSIAICSAFDIGFVPFKIICSLLKIKGVKSGMTFGECRKIINLLAKHFFGYNVPYIPNKKKMTYRQIWSILRSVKGKYLIIFPEHLSYMENGEIYDGFMTIGPGVDYIDKVPTGWWKIN